MASRSNACSEIVGFWLEIRHGFLIRDSVPVVVPGGHSDIDFLGRHSRGESVRLPSGIDISPSVIVESKDEHDWDPSGKDFGQLLRGDMERLGDGRFVPAETKNIKFAMLKQEHFERAIDLFGTDDFDRLFVVHAIDPEVVSSFSNRLVAERIFWLTVPMIVDDLIAWYRTFPRPSSLRHTFMGDLLHLLVGYCGLSIPKK
jgi:hypothetical protein